jgi:hypothetical protein
VVVTDDLTVPSAGQVEIAHEHIARIECAVLPIPIAFRPTLIAILGSRIVIGLSLASICAWPPPDRQRHVIAVALLVAAVPRVALRSILSRVSEVISQAEQLAARGARVDRIVLDYELKRDYQQWLHERDRDGDGRPNREPDEIEEWARAHDLPYFEEKVHFPDLRIEYEEIDGRRDHEDVEVLTVHYRGAHGAAAARSGFSCYRGSSARIGGRGGGSRGGGWHGGLAEELLD